MGRLLWWVPCRGSWEDTSSCTGSNGLSCHWEWTWASPENSCCSSRPAHRKHHSLSVGEEGEQYSYLLRKSKSNSNWTGGLKVIKLKYIKLLLNWMLIKALTFLDIIIVCQLSCQCFKQRSSYDENKQNYSCFGQIIWSTLCSISYQVHTYWDIDTNLLFTAMSIATKIWNETNKKSFNCRVSALIWWHLDPNHVRIATVCRCASHFLNGSNIMERLTAQLFYPRCVGQLLSHLLV